MSATSPFDSCNRCGKEAVHGRPLQRCSRCKIAWYCGAQCQQKFWKLHKKVCKAPPSTLRLSEPQSELVGVRLPGGNNRPFYPSAITVPPEHPVWTMGAISPISQIAGVPLLIHRELQETPLTVPNDAKMDNQPVTYLMISPETGLAAPRWQKNIGPVTIVRADHKPLTLVALEMIWMFCDRIIEEFGDGEAPLHLYSRTAFNQFCRNYQEEYVMNGIRSEEIGAQELPL